MAEFWKPDRSEAWKQHRIQPESARKLINKAIKSNRDKNIRIVTDSPEIFKSLDIKIDENPIYFIAGQSVSEALKGEILENTLFFLLYDCDDSAAQVAKYLIELGIPYRSGGPIGIAHYMHVNRDVRISLFEAADEVKSRGLSHFDVKDFMNIAQAIDLTRDIDGHYVEVGVFNGVSGCFALNYMKRIGLPRTCFFMDVFGGFVYEEAKASLDGYWYNTHTDQHSMEEVAARLNAYADSTSGLSVRVEKNNIISDALPDDLGDIVVLNLDVDMYDAVRAGLIKMAPKIAPKGIIICEDAGHSGALLGARVAVNEFLKTAEGRRFMPIVMESGQTLLINIG